MSTQFAPAATIYVSPQGSDKNDGTALDRPIATLQHAQDIISRLPAQDFSVMIAAGTYKALRTRWRYSMPTHKIKFIGAPNHQSVFDGERKGLAFFRLISATGRPTNLEFEGLTIKRYVNAISLVGGRTDVSKFNSSNAIINNEFLDVGGTGYDPLGYATAVIAGVNSRDNIVAGNVFRHMVGIRCEHLHAVYFAHWSTRNLIENNIFSDGCGDAIRLRDAANDNIIRHNRFVNVGAVAAVSEWWCSGRRNCPKGSPECPPIGTILEGNSTGRNYQGQPLVERFVYKRPVDTKCNRSP